MQPLPVYVIHYHAQNWCVDTVKAFQRSDIPVSVTVVNNGGTTPSGVRVIEMGTNGGYTGGANAAIEDCPDAPFLVVASHDVLPGASTLARLLDVARDHPEAGIVGAEVGVSGPLLGRSGPVEWREWTSGTLLLLRRRCIEQIGLFDERFESYGDDVDIALRAGDAGWKIARVTDAPAASHGSSAGSAYALRHSQANAVLQQLKRGGGLAFMAAFGRLALLVPKALMLGLASGRQFKEYLGYARAYAGAILLVMRRLHRFR